MRLSSYMRQERQIVHSDGDTIIQRWKWGRHLLSDETAVTAQGNLKHGVANRLTDKAKAEGYKLSEREIRYRLQCAKAYKTEAEIGTASADFGDWTSLRQAGFPPVEVPDAGDPYDPRSADEKRRDSDRHFSRFKFMQEVLPGMDEFTTIGDAWKRLTERQELTARRLREDSEVAAELQRLTDAVNGDMSATIADAYEALESEFDDEDDEPSQPAPSA